MSILTIKLGSGWGPIVVTLPSSFVGNNSSSPVTANGSISSVVGGSGSYSYSWTWDVAGSPTAITITNGNTATPTFSAALAAGNSTTGTVRCTVTDTISGQSGAAIATVELNRS